MDEWKTHATRTARAIRTLCQQEGVRGGRILPPRRGARHVSVPVRLANPADRKTVLGLAGDVSLAVEQENLVVVQDGGNLVYQIPLPDRLWDTYTRKNLSDPGGVAVGLGFGEEGQQVNVDFDETPHLVIVGGSQVSGKSTALHSLLVGLMEKLSPGELQVFIIDEAGDCGDVLANAEHLLMPPANTPEQAAAVIDRIMDEKRVREQVRARRGCGLPMLLLAIDEAQSTIPEAGRQKELATLGERIAKLDMHLAIATQKPLEKTLPGVMFNMSDRMTGYVPTSRDASLLTGRPAEEAPAHKLTGRGEFLLVRDGTVTRFTVAVATEEDTATVPMNGTLDWQDFMVPELEEEVVTESASKGGRPRVQADGKTVAHYLMAMLNDSSVSENMARERLGLKYTGHKLNRAFAAEVLETMEALGYEKTV